LLRNPVNQAETSSQHLYSREEICHGKFRLTTAIAIRTLTLPELSFAAGKKGDERKAFMSSCLKKAE